MRVSRPGTEAFKWNIIGSGYFSSALTSKNNKNAVANGISTRVDFETRAIVLCDAGMATGIHSGSHDGALGPS